MDDGLEVFLAAATGTRIPAPSFEEDDGVGGRRRVDRESGPALLGHLRALASTMSPRRALALLAAAVGVVALLVALLSGGGEPTADPALPVAGSSGEPLGDNGSGAAATEAGGSAEVRGSSAEARGGAGSGQPGGDAEVVVVHVAGAVVQPGVHLLPAGSRVHDAVAAAGGPRPEADLDRLNLAAPIADGSQVFVAALGDVGGGAGALPGAGGGSGAADAGGPVSLSTADAAALDALPGVGPSTAAAIISHREANGPFNSVDELLEVRGIGAAKLEGLRDLVVP